LLHLVDLTRNFQVVQVQEDDTRRGAGQPRGQNRIHYETDQ